MRRAQEEAAQRRGRKVRESGGKEIKGAGIGRKEERCQTRERQLQEGRKKGAERGAGTVLLLGIGLLLLIVCGAVLILLQSAVAASRAATAADLAALSAADTVRELRSGDPCTVAADVAGRNGATLTGCSVNTGDQSVQVETEVPVPLLPHPATGHARAGPPP